MWWAVINFRYAVTIIYLCFFSKLAYSRTCLWNSTDQKNEFKNDESRRFLFRFLNKEIKHFGSEAKNQEVK